MESFEEDYWLEKEEQVIREALGAGRTIYEGSVRLEGEEREADLLQALWAKLSEVDVMHEMKLFSMELK